MKYESHLKCGIASALIIGTLMMPVQGTAASGTAGSVASGAGTGAATGAATSAATSGFGALGSGLLSGAASGAASAILTNVVGPGWSQIIGSGIGAATTWLCTDFIWNTAVNIDAAQVALEYMLYRAMQDVTYEWEPKPAESYDMAAQSNEDYQEVPTDSVDKVEDLAEQVEEQEDIMWDFEVQALQNVGIEALSLKSVADMAGGRESVIGNLSQLKMNGDMLELDMDMDQETNTRIKEKQRQNYQWMSTAGVARAQLGLETVNQAAVDAGGVATEITNDTSGDSNIVMSAAGVEAANISETVALKDWPSQSTSTGRGMRIQTLMNLELAQRINLANALQGNILSIEAARALKKAPRVILTEEESAEEGDNDE